MSGTWRGFDHESRQPLQRRPTNARLREAFGPTSPRVSGDNEARGDARYRTATRAKTPDAVSRPHAISPYETIGAWQLRAASNRPFPGEGSDVNSFPPPCCTASPAPGVANVVATAGWRRATGGLVCTTLNHLFQPSKLVPLERWQGMTVLVGSPHFQQSPDRPLAGDPRQTTLDQWV